MTSNVNSLLCRQCYACRDQCITCNTFGLRATLNDFWTYINYSLDNQNNILCYRRFDSRRKSSSGLTSGSNRQYVRACPICGSIGSSPRLYSCCRSSWSVSPPLCVCQICVILDHWTLPCPSLSHGFHCKHDLWGLIANLNWATYGTSSYILTTATGSQSWWRLLTWSRNVDFKVCYFGCLESN